MADPAAHELLDRVVRRIEDRARWHGDAASRRGDLGNGGGLDEHGGQVPALDERAVRHCVIGALKIEGGWGEGVWPLPDAGGRAMDLICDCAGWARGTCHNDEDGHEYVLAAAHLAREVARRA